MVAGMKGATTVTIRRAVFGWATTLGDNALDEALYRIEYVPGACGGTRCPVDGGKDGRGDHAQ